MRRTYSKKQISLHKEPKMYPFISHSDEELMNIQNTQLTADNIIDKLLRPSNVDKKSAKDEKFRPKFEKKDYETISRENINLKMQLKA